MVYWNRFEWRRIVFPLNFHENFPFFFVCSTIDELKVRLLNGNSSEINFRFRSIHKIAIANGNKREEEEERGKKRTVHNQNDEQYGHIFYSNAEPFQLQMAYQFRVALSAFSLNSAECTHTHTKHRTLRWGSIEVIFVHSTHIKTKYQQQPQWQQQKKMKIKSI